MFNKLAFELWIDLDDFERKGIYTSARNAIKIRMKPQDEASVLLDLECLRDEYDK